MATMPESEKKILEEIEFLKDRYFTYDEPIPFCGLTLYPVSVRNYNEFMSSSACLLLNKNDDPAGLRLTNLDYLLSKIKDEKEGMIWSARLSRLIELCMHIKPGMKCNKCGKEMSYNEYIEKLKDVKTEEEANAILKCNSETPCDGKYIPSLTSKLDEDGKKSILVIDGHDINFQDFNRLRKIILYQNLPDYKDDSWVDKAIRDDQAKRAEIQSRNQGSASIERKIICISAATSYTMEQLYDLPLRKFNMLVGAVNDLIDYKITKQGLMSGMVKLKDGQTIDHWLYKKESGLYGSAVDTEGLVNKINSL